MSIEPFYDEDGITLFHGDCTDHDLWAHIEWRLMNELDMHGRNTVMVTDPPYGMAYRDTEGVTVAGDDTTESRDTVCERWGDRPAMVFGTWKVPQRPPGGRVRQQLIWDKGDAPGSGDTSLPWGSSHEEILVTGEGWEKPDSIKRGPSVIRVQGLSGQDKKRPDHPTPKPIPLMIHLIERCPPGIIFDPFAGSGSTLRAALDLGRRAIGVELERKYCDLIVGRLAQRNLF